ncbi:MAG: phage tail sheath C-terminal domain-containing protein [Gemmataceae bacterium]
MAVVQQRTPGVYFEPIDPAPRRITQVRSDIVGFVGVAERGPLNRPVKIRSWTQYLTRFGGRFPDGLLPSAVYGFFENGGDTCWVVRVGNPAPWARKASLVFDNLWEHQVLRVEALDYGVGAHRILVRVKRLGDNRFTLFVQRESQREETWRGLSMAPQDPRYFGRLVNGEGPRVSQVDQFEVPDESNRENLPSFRGSVLIRLQNIGGASLGNPVPSRVRARTDAVEGFLGDKTVPGSVEASPILDNLSLEDFIGEQDLRSLENPKGLACMASIPEVSIVAIPDLVWTEPAPAPREPEKMRSCRSLKPQEGPPRTHPQQSDSPPVRRKPLSPGDQLEGHRAIIRHCASLRDRFGLIDPRPGDQNPNEVMRLAKDLQSQPGQFVALYYPWLIVEDPTRADFGVRDVPPSGHIAGVMARVDLSVGVQKPPANEPIFGAVGVVSEFDHETHGQLNDASVNAIVAAPGRGIRPAGARTLVDRENREWLFINVRRLLIVIEESIEESTQWVVFEPNTPARRRDLDRVVRNYLDDLWRRGRLAGGVAEEAYSVICDESTNPPEEVERGRLICQIGVRPPLPAEFVVVRVGKTLEQAGTVAEGRSTGG